MYAGGTHITISCCRRGAAWGCQANKLLDRQTGGPVPGVLCLSGPRMAVKLDKVLDASRTIPRNTIKLQEKLMDQRRRRLPLDQPSFFAICTTPLT
jgi:hypothetical protein